MYNKEIEILKWKLRKTKIRRRERLKVRKKKRVYLCVFDDLQPHEDLFQSKVHTSSHSVRIRRVFNFVHQKMILSFRPMRSLSF